jgi:polyhydroxybutyrate depolymerase
MFSWLIHVVAVTEAHLTPEVSGGGYAAHDDLRADAAHGVHVPVSPSVGCGKAVNLKRGASTRRVVAGDGKREYLVTIPRDYTENRSYPLLLSLHGYGEDALGLTKFDDTIGAAESGAFIVVHPEGSADVAEGSSWRSWNAVGSSMDSGASTATCNTSTVNTTPCYESCGSCKDQRKNPCSWATCRDDVAFVEAILDEVEATLCVDRSSVHAQGESNGGMMIYELLGSRLAPRFASLVSVIANPAPGTLRLPADRAADFRGRFLGLWGSTDDTMPPGKSDGASIVKSSDGYFYQSSFNTTGMIARHLGCKPRPRAVSSLMESKLSCVSYPGCSVGEVLKCEFSDGHVWPSWLGGVLNSYYERPATPTSGVLAQALVEATPRRLHSDAPQGNRVRR